MELDKSVKHKATREETITECSDEIRSVRDNIRSGRDPLWKMAVENLLLGERTAKMGLKIEEVGLIIAYRTGPHEWTTGIQFMKTDRPYDQIADHLRETHGIPAGFHLGEHDSVELIPGDPKQKLEAAMIPIGLVVVGKSRDDLWADEVVPVATTLLAQIQGRDKTDITGETVKQACSWASKRIRLLSGQSPLSADLVRDIDTDKEDLLIDNDNNVELN